MKKPKVSLAEAAKTSFPQLAAGTNELSSALTDLAGTISDIESSLRRIGINVSAWHTVASGEAADGDIHWSRDIGYTRFGDVWLIPLRDSWQELGEPDKKTTYIFRDAPPWMCLEAAGKIPGLLETLIER